MQTGNFCAPKRDKYVPIRKKFILCCLHVLHLHGNKCILLHENTQIQLNIIGIVSFLMELLINLFQQFIWLKRVQLISFSRNIVFIFFILIAIKINLEF